MTRYLSTGLRIVTAAALSSSLAVSAMAQQTGTQPSQSGLQTPAKTAPVAAPSADVKKVEVKKDAAPVATVKGTETKPAQPATAATAGKPAAPAASATTAAPAAAKPGAGTQGSVAPVEKKTGG